MSPGTDGGSPLAATLVTSAQGDYWKTATWTEVTSNVTVIVSDGKTYLRFRRIDLA